MKRFDIITDLQYGSTGKGLLAGYLAEKHAYDTIAIAWSPNAGHTYIDSNGKKFVNCALPNGIVSPNLRRILIGPGSVIDIDNLWNELNDYIEYLDGVQIFIHENAAVVSAGHRLAESESMFKIGSTMKGVGAAVIEKIKRDPDASIIARDVLVGTPLEALLASADDYNSALDSANKLLLEGAQGFSLSINQGFYPYTTSRDCTTHQLLSDCAIPRAFAQSRNTRVYGCARTYPIRVANRYKDGVQVGTSGPCYDDQREIEWSQLGMEPELTTVTQLPRRIFTFSPQQIADAVRMNGVDEVFLNFVNYIERDEDENALRLHDYERIISNTGAELTMLGWGASHNDVFTTKGD